MVVLAFVYRLGKRLFVILTDEPLPGSMYAVLGHAEVIPVFPRLFFNQIIAGDVALFLSAD